MQQKPAYGSSFTSLKHPGIQHLISQQAALTPGMLAVVRGKNYLTYAQLERQANQLAHALQKREIGPGVCVGVYLTGSVDLLIALLAILKAGGCFVLLETAVPISHVLSQLTRCAAPLVLTHQQPGKQLDAYAGDLLCLDRDQFLWFGESSSPPVVSYTEEQTACVISPSYSNEEHLAVQISQRCLLDYCSGLITSLALEPAWHFSQASTLAVDLAYGLLFPALLTGGCVHLLPEEQMHDSTSLAYHLQSQPIDLLRILPSRLLTLLNADHSNSVLPRKRLLLEGEFFDGSLLERLISLEPSCVIYKHDGLTKSALDPLANPLYEHYRSHG